MIWLITYYNLRKIAIVVILKLQSAGNDNFLYISIVNAPVFWYGPYNKQDSNTNFMKLGKYSRVCENYIWF